MVVQENGHVPNTVIKQEGRASPRPSSVKSRSPIRWTVGLIVRLCIWYTLLTPFLRCPSRLADLTDSSPQVCKPYLIARSHVDPYVTPYYDTYAAPYVDQARPYVEIFNEQVYAPVSKVAKSGYEKYGDPAWQQVQVYGAAQWNAQVTPRLQAAQHKVYQLYAAEVDPYVQQGVAVVSPYYQKASSTATTVYWNHFVPFYTRSQPFIGKTYTAGQDVLITHVVPGAQYTWSSVVYFANSSLWPHLTGLYSEQVEPQLVKIGQRLASYRDGKRLRAVVEDVDSASSEKTVSSTIPSSHVPLRPSNSVSTTTTSTATTTTTKETPTLQPTLSPEEVAREARKRIDSDLERWQEKFALAADRGVEDMEERIEEIVSALIASSANSHGQSLSTALQTVASEKVSSIQQRINDLTASLPEMDAPEEEQVARDQLVSDIRTSAISVRNRAHTLREWSVSFEEELLRRVSAAVDSTLDVLDNIRDLGLQEIGMRWAWTDNVTYKDWARYHALKAQIDDWRNEIRKVGMNHPSVANAKAVASEIVENGMYVAEDTAKELIRLKDVGHWKIAAREVGDNFETRTESPPPLPKPQEEEPEETEETENANSDEAVEDIPETHESAAESESDASIEDDQEDVAADSKPASASDEEEIEVEDDASTLNDDYENLQASGKPAFGVAAANANTRQEPIIDQDDQDVFHNFASKASGVYEDASSALADSTSQAKVLYEIAKSQVIGQMTQSSAPAHEQILSSIESAYSGAVQYATKEFESRLGGVQATPTPSGPLAQISSVASSRLSEGLSLASQQLAQVRQVEPTSTSNGVQPFVLDAQRRYYEAVGLAHDHYTAFVSTASEAVYGTPAPTPAPLSFQDIIDGAGSQYSQASSLASASLAAVVASASSIISSADDGKAQGIIDDASSRYNAAISAASSSLSLASASASSALYGTTSGALESLSSQASENWEGLVSKASEQIYGTPEPYFQQAVHNHVPQFDAVKDVISELLVGKQPSFTESVLSKLRVAYETPYPAAAVSSASSYAGEDYGSASSVAEAYATNVPSVEEAVEKANDQLSDAVKAAVNAYSAASSHVSEAVHGKESGYIDVAKDAIEDIQSKASAAIYGEEPGAVESATSRIAEAVQHAQSQVAGLASSASSAASEAAETVASHVEDTTSSIKAAASSSKDEL
ncbi:hypothetical protein N7509_009659 [Penicillium cosmopolitanum]|uniref:Transcription factor hoxa13 n=1 Tax=Penicillium cosmopolitanum TaxID=1131564 RepID=A0A9W9VPV7_9EURO|nr:uncharacterized protein N7509_009659 [Penicillium cosmopolitanum]KAJ5387118.1 hypothetical protein N7509_009659 [Penicillium cosmopolitanum]